MGDTLTRGPTTIETISEKAKAKRDKVFRVFSLSSAVSDAKSGKSAKQETRVFHADVTAEMDKRLGFQTPLASTCKSLNLQNPWVKPEIIVAIEVTTAASLWALIEDNRLWEAAQADARSNCIDKNLAIYAGKINDSAKGVVDRLVGYVSLMHAAQIDALEPDILADLAADLTAFGKQANRFIGYFVQRTGIEAKGAMENFICERKDIQKNVIKYRAAKTGAVVMDVGLIAGHAAHAAASFGATAALAIIAIVRNVIDIVQIVAKGIMDLEDMAKVIKKEIAFIKAAFDKDESSRALNNFKESVLGVIKGVLKIEIASVDTCRQHIKDYQHKIRALEISYDELGFELTRLEKTMQAYANALNSKDGQALPPKNRQGLATVINESEFAWKAVAKRVESKTEALATANTNVTGWDADLNALEKVTSGWTKYISKLADFATSAGLGLGHIGSESVETAKEIADKHLKLILEGATLVMEVINDNLLEKLQEAD